MKNGFINQITYLYIHNIYVWIIDIYFVFQIMAAPRS